MTAETHDADCPSRDGFYPENCECSHAPWRMAAISLEDGRNWPEDFAHENGQYLNRCISCGKDFVGHKRRVTCKLCQAPEPAPPAAEPQELKEALDVMTPAEHDACCEFLCDSTGEATEADDCDCFLYQIKTARTVVESQFAKQREEIEEGRERHRVYAASFQAELNDAVHRIHKFEAQVASLQSEIERLQADAKYAQLDIEKLTAEREGFKALSDDFGSQLARQRETTLTGWAGITDAEAKRIASQAVQRLADSEPTDDTIEAQERLRGTPQESLFCVSDEVLEQAFYTELADAIYDATPASSPSQSAPEERIWGYKP